MRGVYRMSRDAYFDNAKGIFIFLVVFGHMIQPFIDQSIVVHLLYFWIYLFHMPAFIFISGFFAKGIGNKQYIWNLFKKLLIPYFIFQLIYTIFYYFIGKSDWQTGIFTPQWALWFLISLFCWHLLLIIFKKMKPTYGISIAILIGLVIGYVEYIGHAFSLSRTFVFFPFFLIGYWTTKDHLDLLKSKVWKPISIMILVTAAIIIYFIPEINVGWLLHSRSYIDLGYPVFGALLRLSVYVISLLMAVAIFAWIPRRKHMFTYIGEKTLYVYLLHGFFVQYFRQNDFFTVTHLIDVIGLLIISFAITIILSSKLVVGIAQPIIEGNLSTIKSYWFKKKPLYKKHSPFS